MCRGIILLMMINLVCAVNYGQHKQDYIWVLGTLNYPPNLDKSAYRFDFNQEALTVDYELKGLEMSRTNASICDANGNLLLYTNGCAIANGQDDIITGSDSLNAGNYKKYWLDDCKEGYRARQDILILPDPVLNSEGGYYIIHKRIEYDTLNENIWQQYLLYSYVIILNATDEGELVKLNQEIYNSQPPVHLARSYTTAIQHSNGKDWWILMCSDDLITTYIIILLNEDGFQLIEEKQTGVERLPAEFFSSAGTAKFSPDGTKYANYNLFQGLELFDFDRATGELSYVQNLVLNDTLEGTWFGSVEWSPNGRFLYCAHGKEIFQIDLWEDNLEDGVVKIATWEGYGDPLPNAYSYMSLAPDCRIYVRGGSYNTSYHTIHYPNEKGEACGFQEGDLKLASNHTTGFSLFPNFPRWRVDEEQKCDSTILTMFGDPVYYTRDMTLFPNPNSGDMIGLQLPSQLGGGHLYIHSIDGKAIHQQEIKPWDGDRLMIDLGVPLASGMYVVSFITNDNPKRQIWEGKMVVER